MGDVVPISQARVERVNESRPLREARAHLVETTDDAMELLRWLSTKPKIGFDTETTGIDKMRDRCRLVQIGDDMDGWAINFERAAFLIDDIVRRFDGEYVMHNAPFDYLMADKGGVKINRDKIHDTRIQAHVLSSTGPLGLKPLAKMHIDPSADAAQEELKAGIGKHGGWTWANVPWDYQPYWTYGALDPILTFRLDQVQMPRVMATAPLSYQLEMHVQWRCETMQRKGAAVDRDYTQAYADKVIAYCEQVDEWVRTNYGCGAGQDERLIEVFQREGVQFTKRTKTRYSLDQEVLSAIHHPLAGAVLSRRKLLKVNSTYLSHYLEDSMLDGRVHPSINTVGGTTKNPFESGGARGVRTGRMSMDDPNLQNVPVRTPEGKKVRNCFWAMCDERCGCGEEHVWIKCDFDQIEMRLFAHIAGDQALIDAFYRPGVDMFTASCRDIFNDQHIIKADDRRQYVKNGFYAILYGAGLEQFAKTAGIFHAGTRQPDLGSANAFLIRLHQMYPGIKELQGRVESEAIQRRLTQGDAYVQSPLTSRRFTADPGREYALMNYMVQGAAGEILKMKIIQADHAGLGEYMMFPVHDEIDFDVPKSRLPEVLPVLRDVMNDHELLSVPVTSTASIGSRWGDAEEISWDDV